MCLHQSLRKKTKEVKFQSDTFYQCRSTLHSKVKTGDSYIWRIALSLLVQSGSWNRQFKGGICITPMMSLKGIKWSLNPPTGLPHWGLWERLICSIRKIVNSTLRTQSLDEEVLHNELFEVETIVNSRLITKDSTEPNDLEALKPKSHLLLLKTKLILPPGNSERGCLCMEAMDVLVWWMELRGYVVYIVAVEVCDVSPAHPRCYTVYWPRILDAYEFYFCNKSIKYIQRHSGQSPSSGSQWSSYLVLKIVTSSFFN